MDANAANPFARLRKNWHGAFGRNFKHNGHDVTVTFDAETKEELEDLLPTAEQFWRNREKWFSSFHDHAIKKFVKQLNDRRPEDVTELLSKAELSECVAVPFAVKFYFDDREKCCGFSISAGDTEVMFEYIIEARATLQKGFKKWELISLI
jgi:hypothetical protein